MESLRQQRKEMEKSHLEEMNRTMNDLTHQLEEKWTERLKYGLHSVHETVHQYHNILPEIRKECGLLRQELSQRHSEDSKAALSELASLKDGAMKQAKLEWEEEQAKLLNKVTTCKVPAYVYMYNVHAQWNPSIRGG